MNTSETSRFGTAPEEPSNCSATSNATSLAEPASPTAPPDDIEAIQRLDTQSLRRELAEAIEVTARRLRRLAAIWAELERRGEDLSHLRSGLSKYLPAIAAGQVTAEAVIAFAGQAAHMRAISGLPPEEQRRLAEGGTVTVVEPKLEGGYTHRMLPAASLPGRLVRQVFGDHHVRSETEQIALLLPAGPKAKPGRPPRRGRLRANRERGTILIGRQEIPAADLIAALGDLRSQEINDGEREPFTVALRISAEGLRRLKQRVMEGHTTQGEVIYNALRAMGVI